MLVTLRVKRVKEISAGKVIHENNRALSLDTKGYKVVMV